MTPTGRSRTDRHRSDGHRSLRIVVVTCRTWPDLFPSDAALVDELAARGHHVEVRPWNGAPLEAFTSAELVVLRANWDFHHELATFETWLGAVDASSAMLVNPVELVIAHNHKGYLDHYAAAGIPTPRSATLSSCERSAIEAWMDEHGLERVVVKPAWGASGHGVELVDRDGLASLGQRWLDDGRHVIVQEFVPAISAGERALVFFGGEFSHALLRSPVPGEFRVNSQYGGSMELAPPVEPTAIEFGEAVMAALRGDAAYARIDVVGRDDDLMLMEVEVNEPALGLHLAPGSAARFAGTLERSIRSR